MLRATITAGVLATALVVAGCGGGGDGNGGGGGSGADDLAAEIETCFNEAKLPQVQVTTQLTPETVSAGGEAAVVSHAPEEMNPDEIIIFGTAEDAKARTDALVAEDKAENRGLIKGLLNYEAFGRLMVLTYGEGARQDKVIACAREHG